MLATHPDAAVSEAEIGELILCSTAFASASSHLPPTAHHQTQN